MIASILVRVHMRTTHLQLTIARGVPGVQGESGVTTMAHSSTVLRALGTAFGRAVVATTSIR